MAGGLVKRARISRAMGDPSSWVPIAVKQMSFLISIRSVGIETTKDPPTPPVIDGFGDK